MFHQIKLSKVTQMPNVSYGETKKLATLSPYCVQYIKKRKAEELEIQLPKPFVQNPFVDDYIDSFDSKAEAMEVAKDEVYVHSKGVFTIRNFRLNSQQVLHNLQEYCKSN